MGASKAIAFNEHSPSEPAFAGFFFVKKAGCFCGRAGAGLSSKDRDFLIQENKNSLARHREKVPPKPRTGRMSESERTI